MQNQSYIWETRFGRIVIDFRIWQEDGKIICHVKMHPANWEGEVIFKESSNGKIVIQQGSLLGQPVYGSLEFISDPQAPTYTRAFLTIGSIPTTDRLEGVILEWNDGPNPPPPPPAPESPLPYIMRSEDSIIQEPDQNSAGLVFPMVNLQPWPSIDSAFYKFQFIKYTLETPQSLYASLLSASDLGAAYIACENFIQNGNALSSVDDLPFPFNEFPANYFSLHPFQNESIENTQCYINTVIEEYSLENILEFLQSEQYKNTIDTIWQNWYLLYVLNGMNPTLFVQLTAILRMDHLFSYLLPYYEANPLQEPDWLPVAHLLRAVVVSFDKPFAPIGGSNSVANKPTNGAAPYAIGQMEEIQHLHLGYVKGEISHVENIMQGEKRSLSKRKKERIKESNLSANDHISSSKNTQSDATESMEYEWMKAAAEAYTQYNFTDLNTTFTPPNIFNYQGTVNELRGTSAPTQKTEGKFLENHLRKGLDSIKKQVYSQRLRVHSELTEEIALSEWDNSGRDQNIGGFYRWLNKLYLSRHFKKDKRFFAEINLDSPATNFQQDYLVATGISIEQPKTLVDFGINFYTDLDETTNQENYIKALSYFGISREHILPADQKQMNVIVTAGEQVLLDLPDGYEALSIKLGIPSEIALDPQTTLYGIVGTSAITATTSIVPDFQPCSGKLPISFSVVRNLVPTPITDLSPPPSVAETNGDANTSMNSLPTDVSTVAVSVQIQLQLIAREKIILQVELFNLLQKIQHEKYLAFLQQISNSREAFGSLPYADILDLIKNALKKSALVSLLAQFKFLTGIDPLSPFDTANPGNFYLPAINQFFELVFEWNEMHFLFVTNHSVENYSNKQNEENKNASLILKMLHCDSVRLIVPVKKDQSLQALYFMTCGIPWTGDQHFAPVIGQNLATASGILSLIKTSTTRELLSEWKYEIPTRLLIITQNYEN